MLAKKTILATNYTQLYESNKSRKSIEFQAFQALVKKRVRAHKRNRKLDKYPRKSFELEFQFPDF